ncbi:MAG: serine/threonine-protein kinase [Cytophagaceae bacterium]|nr:serine/threonine-protein kinase [Cytophagaceae bacterium]
MTPVTLEGSNGSYEFNPQNPDSKIGQGGMGVVFQGEETGTNRLVAVKILYRELTTQASHIERARREAAVQIKHPHVLEMLDFVEQNGIYHSISEYLEGETLAHRLDALHQKSETLPLAETRRILEAILSGLEALHQHQPRIIHRDVDPSNVMLCADGRIKLMDFGVVKLNDGVRKSLTTIGTIIGKPHYSAPEQIRNRPDDEVDESTDLYAVGITAYELFTGQVPFDASNEYDLMQLQMQQPLPRHARLNRATYQFLNNATAKEQRHRYRNTAQMLRDLQRLPVGPVEPLRKVLWRSRPVLMVAALLPVVVGGAFYYRSHHRLVQTYRQAWQRGEDFRSRARYDSAAVAYQEALRVFNTDSLRQRVFSMELLPKALGSYRQARYTSALQAFASDTLHQSGEAYYYLGELTANGLGTRADAARAIYLARKAVENGFSMGNFRLGLACETGKGLPKDSATSIAHYSSALPAIRRLAEAGDPEAQSNLGSLYESGIPGVLPKNQFLAFQSKEKAARQGFAFAQVSLGDAYRNGQGTAVNARRAYNWYAQSARMGHPTAMIRLAWMLIDSNTGEAEKWGFQAQRQQYAPAEYFLGWLNQYKKAARQRTRQDLDAVYKQAIANYRQTLQLDSTYAYAALRLAGMCIGGQGTDTNYAQAADWYQKATAQEYAQAEAWYGLSGLYYVGGHGLTKDFKKCLESLQKSADSKYSYAENALGYQFMQNGELVPRNLPEARRWLERALSHGNPNARANLATLTKLEAAR